MRLGARPSQRGRIRSITGLRAEPLRGWMAAACAPDALEGPEPHALDALTWHAAEVPGTAASALRALGQWSLDAVPRRFDASDWWYRVSFDLPAAPERGRAPALCFAGLAGVVDAWLDGEQVLYSENMFVAQRLSLAGVGAGRHELCLRFRSLDALLQARRPRPRWRAPMVENQQLRWFRMTLLGRTPGWSPPAAAVGPWRDVQLEWPGPIDVALEQLATRVVDDAGECRLACRIDGADADIAEVQARLTPPDGDAPVAEVDLEHDAASGFRRGTLRVGQVARWWPHTHGDPALYRLTVHVRTRAGEAFQAEIGAVGFREIEVDTRHDDFAVRVNGVSVFCRGACWTPLDPVALRDDRDQAARAVAGLRAAGMNMVRVVGTNVDLDDHLLDLLDANGILLWQDFMFANLDYPETPEFEASVREEAAQLLARLQGRPSVAVLCGNSEVAQQAAMFGAPREAWQPALFHELLAGLCERLAPDTCYWPSSAWGGAFPHLGSAGTTSYYGVGAYLRPPEDARRVGLRFATECLAFANVPEPSTIARMPGGHSLRVHHPQWKARSPRDLGAGWDFDDVRDHYLATRGGVDPLQLRYADHDRYLELSRVVTGELMAAAFSEWRRPGSSCRGALVLFMRDLWPGAGWGLTDDLGVPKAAWWRLRPALQPLALSMSDEGTNGIAIHVVNDTADAIDARLELSLHRGSQTVVGRFERPIRVPARDGLTLPALALCDGFRDLNDAYRFGPAAQDLVVARLLAHRGDAEGDDAQGADGDAPELARAIFEPGGWGGRVVRDPGLSACFDPGDPPGAVLVGATGLARAVAVRVDGAEPEDNYFDLLPGESRRVRLRIDPGVRRARGTVQAINGEHPVRIEAAA